ncbi:glycosyltransferase [Oscillatoria sp. CS-180]|uniref:glycosyltransferase n=1 Tax=Oscillatoria sp. CS-180 TaxID=3021720 RepID=UPI00233046B2|nr:glycosyltransferase [Oscillatoria sp. CS-180]MDB9527260.1 glycosyltransferase [Oscillatoria sp. CS-180]
MKKTRICITTLEFPPDVGGVGESVARIAHMLNDIGYEVHVAVFHSKQRKDDNLRRSQTLSHLQDDICIHRLYPAIRSDNPIVQDFLSEVYFLLEQLHQRFQFSLFHGFFINETGFLTTLLAKELNIPVINSVRGSDLHKHVFNPKQHGQVTWTLANSDWITCVSHALRHRVCVLVPEVRYRTTAFWNSILPLDLSNLPVPENLNQLQGTVIGSIGRFRDKKGLEFLLDACAELAARIPLTLLLVGDYADRERSYWEQQVQASPIRDRIILTGLIERTQALAYLPYIDIFTVPSLHDGCPNAMLEAMLAERAIVGTPVDAIGEILRDRHNALVVPPGDSSALAYALWQLAQSPSLRQQLGQQARETVLNQLAPAIEQAHWAEVYDRVLQSVPEKMFALSA